MKQQVCETKGPKIYKMIVNTKKLDFLNLIKSHQGTSPPTTKLADYFSSYIDVVIFMQMVTESHEYSGEDDPLICKWNRALK